MSASLPQAGQPAPAFAAETTVGRFDLAAQRGRKIVLYFYPKDDTPGCTIEAIDFSRLAGRFAEAETEVYGISKDSIASHASFCGKHDLKIPLITDGGTIAENYGVWVEKNMYGKKYMGINRVTFLIDREGKIARVWPKVKVEGHAEEVLAAAQAL